MVITVGMKSLEIDDCMENILDENVWKIADDIYYIRDRKIAIRCKKDLLGSFYNERIKGTGMVDKCIWVHNGICYHDVLKIVESSDKNVRFTITVDAPSKANDELIDMLKDYFSANGISNTRYVCALTEREACEEDSPYDCFVYRDGLNSFRKNNWLSCEQIIKNNKMFCILQFVDAENFESIYKEAVYLLNKYDDQVVPMVHFMVVNDINSPTIPYMKYSRIINSLKSQFYNRISCCEYVFKEIDRNVCSCKAFRECRQCLAYGFCAGICEQQGFNNIEYDNPIQQRICFAKRNIVKANLHLMVEHEGRQMDVNGESITYSYIDNANYFMGEMACWFQKKR